MWKFDAWNDFSSCLWIIVMGLIAFGIITALAEKGT